MREGRGGKSPVGCSGLGVCGSAALSIEPSAKRNRYKNQLNAGNEPRFWDLLLLPRPVPPSPAPPVLPAALPAAGPFPGAAATPRRGAPRIPRGRGETAGKGSPRNPPAAPPHLCPPGRYSGFGDRIHQVGFFFFPPSQITLYPL